MSEASGPDYFALFGLPESFEVDTEALAERYRELQREAHPDRHAGGDDRERRLAVQEAANINEGYRVLKDPVARARHLLERRGLPMNDETDTTMDPSFLMQQMELREQLAAVRQADDPFAALDELRRTVDGAAREQREALAADFTDGSQEALERAREGVRKLQFLHKLAAEADAVDEDLTEAS